MTRRWPWLVTAALLVATVTLSVAATGAATSQPASSMVIVGVGGLRWFDLSPQVTPTLWRLVASSSVGSISVRTVKAVTCPLDAWLTISTGQRALGSPSDSSGHCPPLPSVAGGQVSGWRSYVALQRDEVSSYGDPGLLGDQLSRSRQCAIAVGPGAAVALATSAGRVASYVPTLAADLPGCSLMVVDAGRLPGGAQRVAALKTLDELVARVMATLPARAPLLVAGIADAPSAEPGLEVAIAHDGRVAPGWLTSNSTRRTGLIQLTDLTATALLAAGSASTGVDGAPVVSEGSRGLTIEATVQDRLDAATLTDSLPSMAPRLGVAYLLLVVLALGLVAVVWRRRTQRGAQPALPAAWRTLALVVAVAAAATPLSAYLPTLVSWWTTSHPALALLGAAAVVIAAVTLLALLVPIHTVRSAVFGPALVVSGLTFLVLTIDALSGTPLQVASPLVSGPVTGGRFYGFSNVTFAVYVTSALLLSGALAELVRPRWGAAATAAMVAGTGLVALICDGWPTLGADFGGILAMLPGFGYLTLVLAGRRVTWQRAGVLAVGAVAVTVVISVLDWLRPPAQRSHFGSFVQKVLDGQAGDMVLGKATAALHTLANPTGLLAVVVLVAAVALVVRPDRFGPSALRDLWSAWPALLPTLRAVAIVAVLGTLLNDSGVLVAGAMLATAIPLVLAAALRSSTIRPAPAAAALVSRP